MENPFDTINPLYIEGHPHEVNPAVADRALMPRLRGSNTLDGLVITVDIGHEPSQVAETLLHEILHTIYNNRLASSLPDVDAELVVDGMSLGLTEVILHNPGLLPLLERLAARARPEVPSAKPKSTKKTNRRR